MPPLLIGYLVFGAGYIAHMTFMIAWIRDGGAPPSLQALFVLHLAVSLRVQLL